ncbi:type VII secretion system-associated protein [Streptomyces sp. ODS28]|uniref:type VII secretion system-associated protein n=1 Tax=Streptomyces sp. ODS28 TaxID=3136688 RepID=UPI0031EC7574
MPPVPDEIREAGRLAPDHWLGMVDPTWQGEGRPPAWALVGQWRSSPEGEIVEWQDNEEYRPSPRALGWPEPLDEVDAAVQLAATGYGPGEDVTGALAATEEVAVFVTPDGSPLAATAPDEETPVVPVFTSPAYLHTSGRLAFALHPVRALLERLPEGHLIYLNPSAPVSMTVDTDELRALLGARETPADGAEEDGSGTAPVTVGNGIPVMGAAGGAKAEKPAQSAPSAETTGTARPAESDEAKEGEQGADGETAGPRDGTGSGYGTAAG